VILLPQVEMYADPGARGGVLEAEGMVEIKFRTPDLIKTMHRLDSGILKLKADAQPGMEAAIKAREAALLPVYRQVTSPSQPLQFWAPFLLFCPTNPSAIFKYLLPALYIASPQDQAMPLHPPPSPVPSR